jgi:RNA polymerase sigma factor (sigma-70 family)
MRGGGADGPVGAMRPGKPAEQRGPTTQPRTEVNQEWEEPMPEKAQDYLSLLAKLFEANPIVALRALPERDRRVLEFIYFNGLTYKEAAVVLGISVSTMRTLVVRATRRLRKLMAEEGEEVPASARMQPSRP